MENKAKDVKSARAAAAVKPAIRFAFGPVYVVFVLAALVGLFIFWRPLTSGETLVASDLSVASIAQLKSRLPGVIWGYWDNYLLGQSMGAYNILPRLLLLFVMSPDTYYLWAFIADVALLFGAMHYLLRGKGISRTTAAIGALAMAFSGHSFTLISAGHLSKFGMMPYAVFTLACMDRAVTRRSLFHFAMSGICAGIGLAEHQDVMLMFCVLTAVYGIFKWSSEFPREGRPAYMGRIVAGVALAALLFGGVSLPTFISTFRVTLPSRGSVTGETPQQKWEFATNWSLPPEEIVEFLAPCVYGTQTGDPKGPYWGRLGRTPRWETTHQGLMNLRQHTVYLGGLQSLFALYAVLLALWSFGLRKRGLPSESRRVAPMAPHDHAAGAKAVNEHSGPAETGAPAAFDRPLAVARAEIIFWAVIWIVCVLLALGRYAPLYRLFYSLPFVSGIRAPVKFMHLVEVATVILFAYGLDACRFGLPWGSAASQRVRAIAAAPVPGLTRAMCLAIAAIAVAASLFFVIAMAWVDGGPATLVATWTSIGFAPYQDLLKQTMSGALGHAALVLFAGSILFGACAFVRQGRARTIGCVLAVAAVIGIDLGSVDARYVTTSDLSSYYADDPVTETLASEREPFRVMCPLMDGAGRRWMNYPFISHGFDTMDLSVLSGIAPDYRAFFEAVGANSIRLWQLANVRYLVGSKQGLEPLLKHEAFQAVVPVAFRMRAAGGAEAVKVPLESASHVLLLNRSALPRALVYHAWETLDDAAALKRLADPDWNPGMSVLVATGVQGTMSNERPGTVEIKRYSMTRIDISVTTASDGVLLLNDRYDPDWRVTVDGQPAELLRCNYIMRGVKVMPGTHDVSFAYKSPYIESAAVRIFCLFLGLAWILARFAAGRPRRGAPSMAAAQ